MAFSDFGSVLRIFTYLVLIIGCITFKETAAEDGVTEPLRITFGKFRDFAQRPDDFKPVHKDETCESGKFKGNRFMKPGDPSIILIYDAGDNLVGTQAAFFMSEIKKVVGTFSKDWQKWFIGRNPQMLKEKIDGKIVYVMTIYKQDPDTICESTEARASDSLYIVHHENKTKYLKVNRNDESSLSKEGWIKNLCIENMGYHYRYKFGETLDWNCFTGLTPIFLMVDNGKIIGHGWNFAGNFSSQNFEHFPYSFAEKEVADPMPVCILKAFNATGSLMAEHVYYTDKYAEITCPKA